MNQQPNHGHAELRAVRLKLDNITRCEEETKSRFFQCTTMLFITCVHITLAEGLSKQQHTCVKSSNLVGPLVGLQQLRVQRSFILNRVQAQQTAVMERMRLGGTTDQAAETLQLAEGSRAEPKEHTTQHLVIQTVSHQRTLTVSDW